MVDRAIAFRPPISASSVKLLPKPFNALSTFLPTQAMSTEEEEDVPLIQAPDGGSLTVSPEQLGRIQMVGINQQNAMMKKLREEMQAQVKAEVKKEMQAQSWWKTKTGVGIIGTTGVFGGFCLGGGIQALLAKATFLASCAGGPVGFAVGGGVWAAVTASGATYLRALRKPKKVEKDD